MDKEKIISFSNIFKDYLIDQGLTAFTAKHINIVVVLIILAGLAYLLDRILRKIIVKLFVLFSEKTETTFDDFLVQSKFPRYVAHIIPLILLKLTFPVIFVDLPFWFEIFNVAINVYGIILIVKIIRSVLRSSKNFLRTKEQYSDKPLESYLQVILIFLWGLAGMFVIYELTGKDVLSLASLGAASAILLLIFKDTILGFVASIQVSVNDIVRIGDWITFSKYGADGTVIDINLATVRVQNFDNTFTTIPTYALISDSFQNWRGMQESGGRRIKRAIYIKQSSIKYLTPDKMEELKKIQLVKNYIEHRQLEIDRHNKRVEADKSVLINGRNQTNFGVFRKYLDSTLRNNTGVNNDMMIMVRQLQPTQQGIPLEIYCFSTDKRWENYEAIMSDVFDHLIAAVPYFDLELFEEPSGNDIKALLDLNKTVLPSHLKK
ncbi:MAG: mechanosensitive ion channel family protein [Flavobacteriaceae bacterium]|nr:mechanosensitive ion channel family protein [Flavobacteriaceae bacterium]